MARWQAQGMTRYRFTPQAFDDIFDICGYIAQDN
jgi:hypothetical protein